MQIELVGDYSFLLDTVDGCNNPGPCCYSCPAFDGCEQHDDSEDEA